MQQVPKLSVLSWPLLEFHSPQPAADPWQLNWCLEYNMSKAKGCRVPSPPSLSWGPVSTPQPHCSGPNPGTVLASSCHTPHTSAIASCMGPGSCFSSEPRHQLEGTPCLLIWASSTPLAGVLSPSYLVYTTFPTQQPNELSLPGSEMSQGFHVT